MRCCDSISGENLWSSSCEANRPWYSTSSFRSFRCTYSPFDAMRSNQFKICPPIMINTLYLICKNSKCLCFTYGHVIKVKENLFIAKKSFFHSKYKSG